MNSRRIERALAAALVFGVLLTGCTNGSSNMGTGPSSGTSTPATSDPTASISDYTLIPDTEGDEDPVWEAGRYATPPHGPNLRPLAVVDVPFTFVGDSLIFPVDERTGAIDDCCIVGYWTVAGVYKDPCKARVAADPGPSVQDLAQALVDQRTTSTVPIPVSVGGYDGLYLELTAPAGLGHLSTCRYREITYWESDPGARHFGADHYDAVVPPVERIWILDVAGTRVVLSVGVESGIDKQRTQELIDIVESAHFDQT